MTFFKYLDVRFTNLSIETQLNGFDIAKDGESKAVHFLVGMQRTYYKWISVPLILIDYLLVKCCLKKPAALLELPKRQLADVAGQAEQKAPSATSTEGKASGPH